MPAVKKSDVKKIEKHEDLNSVVSQIYHYSCGISNAKTKEEVSSYGTTLKDLVVELVRYKMEEVK